MKTAPRCQTIDVPDIFLVNWLSSVKDMKGLWIQQM